LIALIYVFLYSYFPHSASVVGLKTVIGILAYTGKTLM